MGERAYNYLALKSGAISKISTGLLKGLVDQSSAHRASEQGRVFVFETNFAPMYARKGPGSTLDLEFELAIHQYLTQLKESEYRMIRVSVDHSTADHRGEWVEHQFHHLDQGVQEIEVAFRRITRVEDKGAEKLNTAAKADMRVNAGALVMAINVLRRAGKHEVAAALEATAIPEPREVCELVGEINRLVQDTREKCIEPFSVRVSDEIDIEIRPQQEGHRVLVGHEGWGCTTVNYTAEGLIIDVVAEDKIDPIHTASIGCDELVSLEASF